MKLLKLSSLVLLSIFLSIKTVFAETFSQVAFENVLGVVQNDIIISGLSVIFIFWGLYTLFFWGTRFISRDENGGNHRIRIAISVILAFFVGSYIVLTLGSAGDRFGYVLAAWIVMLFLLAGFFVAVYKIYSLYFGDESKAKSTVRILMFILTIFVFLFIYTLVFSKVAYVVLTDGQGDLTVLPSATGTSSVTQNLESVENQALSQGGLSGSILGYVASLLASAFSFISGLAIIATLILLVLLVSKHKKSSEESPFEKSSGNTEIREIRDLIKKMNTTLKEASTHFNNKTRLLNGLIPKSTSPKEEDTKKKEYGITHRDQYGFPHYGYK